MSPPTILEKNKFGYDWVLLNSRWYIVQNYSPDKLADDTDIPIVTDQSEWNGRTTPARCVYNNSIDAEFIDKYGFIYNRHAVNAGLKMPCSGCHVATGQEWISLKNWMIANGFNWDGTTEGNKIGKALASDGGEWNGSATSGHVGNDQSGNNSSGFTALPGGYRWGNEFSQFAAIGTRIRYHCVGNIIPSLSHNRVDLLFTDGVELNNDNGYYVKITATAPVVTFNSNGGSAVEDEVTFVGELATAPTAPTRAGFNFNGWYSDEALTTEWDFATDTVDADTTLYAGWAEIPVINGDVQSGPASVLSSIKPLAIITAAVQSGIASVSASVKPIATVIGNAISGSATVTGTAKTVVKIIGSVQSGVASVTARIFPFVEMKTSELRIFTVPFKSRIYTKKRR